MPNKKKNPLDVKIPMSFGIRRRTLMAFERKCDELGISKSVMVESLIEEFIRDG